MDATSPTLSEAARAQVAGQLAFYGVHDDQWLPVLLDHLGKGGVILVERTGDLLILPAP